MASGALAPIGRQFFDNAGAVLASGTLTTYLTGSTTLAPTYTNIDLASPSHLHSNPIVLNSAGRPPASVFLPRGTTYRVLVKDSAGVLIEDIEGVLVADDTYSHTANVEVPIGGLIPYGGTAAPTKFLMCDGTAYSRATYAALFGVIGEAYGVGDASTTFNVPDMRGFYPFGKAPAAVSTPADPTLATNQSGTDLAAGNYKVAIVGVGKNGAVSLPSSSVTQAVGAGGAGRIVVTWTLPTGATKVRVYVTTLAGATCDRYFEATASPFNFNTLTGAVVAALPTAATVTGAVLGASFGQLDHAHLGPSHVHGMTGSTYSEPTTISGSTAAGGTEAVTGTTASGTANITTTEVTNLTAAGATTRAIRMAAPAWRVQAIVMARARWLAGRMSTARAR
jgi:microcystin-dependent protein